MTTALYPDIAFIGGMGVGKSTAAKLLADHYSYERLSFATPLKVMAGPDASREFLQRLGTDVIRKECPDAWVNIMTETLEAMGYLARIVIDDCRFPNEAQRLKEQGFIFVRLHAGLTDRQARLTSNGKWGGYEALEHESETALKDFKPDYNVGNYGGLDELLGELTNILNQELR